MQDSSTTSPMDELTLGQAVNYPVQYSPSLLQGVPRLINRQAIGLSDDNLPFSGVDIWNGYELSWLNLKGKPCVAIVECHVPITSPNLIESKSFKLYLNSFNQSRFSDAEKVKQTIEHDLTKCAGCDVTVSLILPIDFPRITLNELDGISIDDADIEISNYDYSTSSLSTGDKQVTETLTSNLLKSNCLITNQPDWGSVLIHYRGKKINRDGLLKYIVSFRTHNEFHEQCVERIFCDIKQYCNPEALTVYARYTRRGGLDINPFRSDFEQPYANKRLARQ